MHCGCGRRRLACIARCRGRRRLIEEGLMLVRAANETESRRERRRPKQRADRHGRHLEEAGHPRPAGDRMADETSRHKTFCGLPVADDVTRTNVVTYLFGCMASVMFLVFLNASQVPIPLPPAGRRDSDSQANHPLAIRNNRYPRREKDWRHCWNAWICRCTNSSN